MKIVIASDHGGYQLKQSILHFLSEEKIDFEDFGINSADSADYPDYAVKQTHGMGVDYPFKTEHEKQTMALRIVTGKQGGYRDWETDRKSVV